MINECLEGDSVRTQEFAAILLQAHAKELLIDDDNLSMPYCLLEPGLVDLPEKVMVVCVAAISTALRARSPGEWHPGTVVRIVALLWGFVQGLGKHDYTQTARHGVAAVTRVVGGLVNPSSYVIMGTEQIRLDLLLEKLDSICRDPPDIRHHSMLSEAQLLTEWRQASESGESS